MSEPFILGGYPDGRQLEGDPDRPAGQFGNLRPATDALCKVLRRNIREIPDDQLTRLDGGRYWIDDATGEPLEIVTHYVDPIAPGNVVAFAVRDGYVVTFKRRDDQGDVTSVSIGSVGGSRATGKERAT